MSWDGQERRMELTTISLKYASIFTENEEQYSSSAFCHYLGFCFYFWASSSLCMPLNSTS